MNSNKQSQHNKKISGAFSFHENDSNSDQALETPKNESSKPNKKHLLTLSQKSQEAGIEDEWHDNNTQSAEIISTYDGLFKGSPVEDSHIKSFEKILQNKTQSLSENENKAKVLLSPIDGPIRIKFSQKNTDPLGDTGKNTDFKKRHRNLRILSKHRRRDSNIQFYDHSSIMTRSDHYPSTNPRDIPTFQTQKDVSFSRPFESNNISLTSIQTTKKVSYFGINIKSTYLVFFAILFYALRSIIVFSLIMLVQPKFIQRSSRMAIYTICLIYLLMSLASLLMFLSTGAYRVLYNEIMAFLDLFLTLAFLGVGACYFLVWFIFERMSVVVQDNRFLVDSGLVFLGCGVPAGLLSIYNDLVFLKLLSWPEAAD